MMDTETAVISARLDAVQRELSQLSTVMGTVAESLTTLVRLEAAHGFVLERMRQSDKEVADLRSKIQVVELDMPGLREMRRWVLIGVIGSLGMIGAALLKLVIFDIPRIPDAMSERLHGPSADK